MVGHQAVEAALERRRDPVNQGLAEAVPAVIPGRLQGATQHLLEAGGKRLRPTMLLLSAEALAGLDFETASYRQMPAVDGDTVDVLSAGVSIEFVQTFTLVHDDLIDNDDVRRGAPSVHREYDTSMAILAGDVLYARAFEVLLQTGASPERALRAVGRLASACTEICEGQSVDIAFEHHQSATVEEYLDMIDRKTAVLFATSACLPAILLGHDDAVEPLAEYGRDVGRAFQIHDDLLDLTTPTETLGKQRGSDLIEGKQTLVTTHAREQGVDIDGLLDGATAGGVSNEEIDRAVEKLAEAGSLEFARDRAREFVENGKRHLDVLPDGEPRRLLAGTADYLVEREY
ncbi:MAG: geranylgeranyl diphosphate synthase type I [Halovenus sp.]|jgi:geranylgeranyl diphosphate synthase type I